MSAPISRGASRLLRSVPRRSSYIQQRGVPFRRCMSSLNVESQQKVREGSTPVAPESAPADKVAEQQLLATHLKEADPAMYEIIENASTSPHLHPHASTVAEGTGSGTGHEANCARENRRRRDKSTLSTSFPPRTSHLRPSWTPLAVLCRVRTARGLFLARREIWLTFGLQTSTPKGIPERDTMAATSSSTSPKDYANREHSRPLVWTPINGESTCNVRTHPPCPSSP